MDTRQTFILDKSYAEVGLDDLERVIGLYRDYQFRQQAPVQWVAAELPVEIGIAEVYLTLRHQQVIDRHTDLYSRWRATRKLDDPAELNKSHTPWHAFLKRDREGVEKWGQGHDVVFYVGMTTAGSVKALMKDIVRRSAPCGGCDLYC